MANIFGFEIKRTKKDEPNTSFAPIINDDGAVNVEATATGGSYGFYMDIEGTAKNESELIGRYRTMAMQPEIQQAVDEIVNEAISIDTTDSVVKIVLDNVELPIKVKNTIIEEFDNVLRMFDFSNQGYEIFQRFYVDGRLNYHVIIDEDNLKDGVKELRYLDPRKIRLIRETDSSTTDRQTGLPLKKVKKEYYMYSESGFGTANTNANGNGNSNNSTMGYRIAKDTIARVTSGLLNENQSLVLSHLHRAIKPLNQLRVLEDATIVYTLTRAPERRIFYVDVGNLPKAKAEQYLADMMARHKNKIQYNSSTGEMTDSRNFMTMTEDFWFPRREGSRSTEVDTLPGGASMSENNNLEYFQKKLYKSLAVPISRLEPETMHSFGRVSEMTRDEMRFSKFIQRLRSRFSNLFDTVIEKQLILKGILTPEEWTDIKDYIRYDFMKDNYFEELKKMEILKEKMGTIRDVEEHVGKYFSRNWIQQNVLFFTENEIAEMQEEIDAERKAGIYKDQDEEVDTEQEYSADEPSGEEPDREDEDEDTPDGAQNNNEQRNINRFETLKRTRRNLHENL